MADELIKFWKTIQCLIGNITQDLCDNSVKIPLSDLSDKDLLYLDYKLKTSLRKFQSNRFICQKHKSYYVDYYSNYRKKCCDPLNKHVNIVKSNMRVISEALSNEYYALSLIRLIPGDKLCHNCELEISDLIKTHSKEKESIKNESCEPTPKRKRAVCLDQYSDFVDPTLSIYNNLFENMPESSSGSSKSIFMTHSQEAGQLNKICDELGLSHPKIRKLSTDRKEKAAISLLTNIEAQVAKKICNVFQIHEDFCSINIVTDNLVEDSRSLRSIIKKFQEEYKNTREINKKITILMQLPDDWSFEMIKTHFSCSNYMWRKSKKLLMTQGRLILLY